MTFLELVLGIVIGLVTNFAVWALLFHGMVPRIRFSNDISKIPMPKSDDDKSGSRYRFRIENAGHRDIIDIELAARLSFKGIRSGTWNTIYLPLNFDGSSTWRVPILHPARKGKVGHRITVFIHPNGALSLKQWQAVPSEVRAKAAKRGVLLEDLLGMGSEAQIQVLAYCYDSFSGSRKLFRSRPYTLKNIATRRFKRNSLDVVPASDDAQTSPGEVTHDNEDPALDE